MSGKSERRMHQQSSKAAELSGNIADGSRVVLDQAVQRFRKQQILSQLGLYGVNKKKVDRAVYF